MESRSRLVRLPPPIPETKRKREAARGRSEEGGAAFPPREALRNQTGRLVIPLTRPANVLKTSWSKFHKLQNGELRIYMVGSQ